MTTKKKGMDYKTCDVILKVTQQSPDINQAVTKKDEEETGAGDQGHMFGYATDETPELFPFSHLLALKLSQKLTEVRKNKILPWLRPDGKTQVTVEYKKIGNNITPLRIHNILISAQHDPDVSNEEIRAGLLEQVIHTVAPKEFLDDKTQFFFESFWTIYHRRS